MFPLIERLDPAPDRETVFPRFAALPHCVFLDSALHHAHFGRYSFLAADPFEFIRAPDQQADPFDLLAKRLAELPTNHVADMPPFQGGAVGLFSYELSRKSERLPATRFDEFQLPWFAVGLYDVVLAYDHVRQSAWLISQGWPETEPQRRLRRAEQRLAEFRTRLQQPAAPRGRGTADSLTPAQLAPQFPAGRRGGITSNFDAAGYTAAVARIIEYIQAGDIFQANFAQRLLSPAADDSVSLYLRLRQRNPATFAAYFDLGPFQVISASPERFLKVHERRVEARPIKGTRQRTLQPEADLFAADDLLRSEKDRSENVMIVDLMRNDLARVCRPASVQVTQLCELEVYAFVQHLVSAVEGQLRDTASPLDLLQASFPAGSITGAPKVRAMEIIAELEPTARGAYCGSLGYIGPGGEMDLSVLIRTVTAGRGWWQLPVGGGIVAQSDPRQEYQESWHKAEGLLRSLQP